MVSLLNARNFLRSVTSVDLLENNTEYGGNYIGLPRRNTFDRIIDYCENPQIKKKEFSLKEQVEFSRFLYGNKIDVITKQPNFNM
jgi:hypothetical protein